MGKDQRKRCDSEHTHGGLYKMKKGVRLQRKGLSEVSAKLPTADMSTVERYTHELSKSTKVSYSSDIKQFFGVRKLSSITVDMIQSVTPEIANNWAHDLYDKGYKPQTINKKLTALHGLYKYCCRTSVGLMTYNPFDTQEGCIRFKNAISKYSSREPLEIYEVKRLLNACKFNSHDVHKNMVDRRNRAIIQVLLITGMRREELTRLKVKDYYYREKKHLLRIVGKRNKERFAVIPTSVYRDLKLYLKYRGIDILDKDKYGDFYIFTSHTNSDEDFRRKNKNYNVGISNMTVNNVVANIAKKAGFPKGRVTPHILRHTFCTESLRTNASIVDVADLMGHENIATTRRYDHINRTIEHSTSDELAQEFGL